MNASFPRFNLPVGQFVELDGRMLRFVRRGRDKDRRLVFEGLDGVPADLTDQEFLDLQHKERRLKLLTAAEASHRLEEAGRPRVSLLDNDAPSNDEARLRLDYIRGWEREGCPSRTEEVLRPIVGRVFDERRSRRAEPVETAAPSPRKVIRWIADWVESGGNIEALVPQTRNRGNRTDRLHPKAREIVERVVEDRYLVDTRPTAVAVHAHVLTAFGDYNKALPEADKLAVPSIKTVHRIIAGIDRYTLDCTRIGRRTADHRWRPVMSAPQTTHHNEIWEIDHTPVDAMVLQDGTLLPIGRPLVTSCLDRHTRAVPGFYIGFDAAGTHPTLECMRVAILPKDALLAQHPDITGQYPCMGTPEILVPDGGREFKGRDFVNGCLTIGTDIQYTPVLKAWYKGKIERFFRTLTRDVFQRVPGTTFSNVFERNKETIPEQIAVVTLSELRRLVLHYIVEIYHRRRHRGMGGVTPMEAWAESVRRNGMRPLPDPERIAAALSRAETRIPQRYGIEFEGLIYNSAEVAAYRVRPGAPRWVRIAVDPHDLTSIRFLDPADNRFVEVPIQPGMRELVRGVSLDKHKLARAMQRANPEHLAGARGLAKAYTLLDDGMRELGAANGQANRRKAASYWEKLLRARPPEDPPAFDTLASARGVTDSLFGDTVEPEPPPPPSEGSVDVPAAALQEPVRPKRTRKPKEKRTGGDGAHEPGETAAPAGADDDDGLAAFARSLGMSVRKNPNGEQG